MSKEFNLTVLEDVKIIISGPGQSKSLTFMSAALSDLILLLRTALVIIKKGNACSQDVVELFFNVNFAQHILNFFSNSPFLVVRTVA